MCVNCAIIRIDAFQIRPCHDTKALGGNIRRLKMNILFSRPFDDIEESDLKDLIEMRKVREYVSLDYKKSYSHNHKGTVNLLSDITAMANSHGGYIIIGVEEDTNAPMVHLVVLLESKMETLKQIGYKAFV
jgi:hypothetical protein